MNASPCCSVSPGAAGRQAIGYETAAMAPVACRANLESPVAVQPGSATSASAIELIVVLSREHKSLLKHLESTHKMMLSRIVQKVYGTSTELVNMPELLEEQQPPGVAASLIVWPEPKEDQASRARAQPERVIVRVTCVSTQTYVDDVPEGASSSTDVPAVTGAEGPVKIEGQPEEDTNPKQKVAVPFAHIGKRDTLFVFRSSSKLSNVLHDGVCRQMEKIVLSTVFETVFALLIVVNALVMAAEAQYRGMDVAFRLEYKGARESASESWPGARMFFDVLEVIFGVLFVLELSSKMLVLRQKFVKSIWNFLDTVIVGGWLLDVVFHVNTFLNPMMLRLFRLVKLLRVAKLFKTFRAFDSLSILMSSMKASISVLFWSIVLLFTVQMAAALFFFQVLEDRMMDPSNENSLVLYQYFGSFTRAFLTMMELTLVNWTPVCRMLTERVAEWYGVPVVIYVLLVNFAAIKVIAAVFIFETQKVASTDEDLLILQKVRQTARLEQNFAGVFKEIDDSSDGFLTWEEFERVVHDQRVLTWLAALDLDVHQCESLFCLLDDGDGKISFQEFVDGVHRLKGAAKSVDLVTMSHQQTEIHKTVCKIEQMCKNR